MGVVAGGDVGVGASASASANGSGSEGAGGSVWRRIKKAVLGLASSFLFVRRGGCFGVGVLGGSRFFKSACWGMIKKI